MLEKSDLPYICIEANTPTHLDFAPDIIVIMLGSNDSKHHDDGSLDADNAPENWAEQGRITLPDYETIDRRHSAGQIPKVKACSPVCRRRRFSGTLGHQ